MSKESDGRKTVYALTDAGHEEVERRSGELENIEAGLADSVRLIADEVRGSVREAMKSLRADLAAAAQSDRESASDQREPQNQRSASREQVHRADAALTEFRGNVRADLRSHVARGGALDAATVDALISALDETQRTVTRALQGARL